MPQPGGPIALRRTVALAGALLTLIVLASLLLDLRQIRRHLLEQALTEARTLYDVNLAYRRWSAGYGGVYVPVEGRVHPNPYLAGYPRRDLAATDGTRLTLVNPAMMTREAHAVLAALATRPVLEKVTSLKSVNPANAPDAWEAQALRAFEAGTAEASAVATIGGEAYMRLLRPLVVEKGCLVCHEAQQYRLGDIRGGLSIGVPMRSYLEQMARERRSTLASHLVIWLIGMGGIGALALLVQRAERRYAGERHVKESAVSAAAAEWAATFDAINDSILILDPEYRVLRCNVATTRLLGLPWDQILGRSCRELMHEGAVPAECPVGRALGSGKPESSVITLRGRTCLVSADPVLDASGRAVKIVHTIRDITEGKKLEAQLFQAQKMEAVGTLAAGVAHDFNNILSAIVGYASLLELKTAEDDPRRSYVRSILASTERAASLTRSLLSFGRKHTGELTPVALNETVTGFQKILARLIGEDIAITLACFPGELVVAADKGQIEQILMNLATNARDAMPQGGRLTIRTERADFDRDSGEIASGSYAVIVVADSGVGMDRETQAHLFEPFFTTKDVGKGTGLGLSIVYGIVRKHGGAIHVYSEHGLGTTFKVFLPLFAGPGGSGLRAAEAPARPPAGGSETILLVEDDSPTREVARILLEEFGYTVLVATDGDQAVRIFREDPDRIQLVLTDLIMPKKSGREAVEEMRAIRPELRAIYMSGYAEDVLEEKSLLQRAAPFLAKPLNPADLLNLVREVLASRA